MKRKPQTLLFVEAYEINVCYGCFRQSAAKVAQVNSTAAQKTPWFAHLYPQLIGNAVCHPFMHRNSFSHRKVSIPSMKSGGKITVLLQKIIKNATIQWINMWNSKEGTQRLLFSLEWRIANKHC
jgi:hypothetical protein